MARMMTAIERLVRGDDAQDLLEYALLAGLIVVVAIAGITSVGNTVLTVFWSGIGAAV
jgi:Flp pilus assembly pilin Flp